MIKTITQEFRYGAAEEKDAALNRDYLNRGWRIRHIEHHTMAYQVDAIMVDPHGWVRRTFILEKEEK